MVPCRPNQLWVSDITYWRINKDFLYISFITDAYSRKIVGYNVAENLLSLESVKALKMAVENTERTEYLYQYCSNEYIRILEESDIRISLTQSGDPRDNAIA